MFAPQALAPALTAAVKLSAARTPFNNLKISNSSRST